MTAPIDTAELRCTFAGPEHTCRICRLADELDRLRAECDEWKRGQELLAGMVVDLRAENEALRARVSELEGAIERVGGVDVEERGDTLAVALCSYFDDHPQKPDDDQEDNEYGWHPWVAQKCDEALALIRAALEGSKS